jgi:hypothetical protein
MPHIDTHLATRQCQPSEIMATDPSTDCEEGVFVYRVQLHPIVGSGHRHRVTLLFQFHRCRSIHRSVHKVDVANN